MQSSSKRFNKQSWLAWNILGQARIGLKGMPCLVHLRRGFAQPIKIRSTTCGHAPLFETFQTPLAPALRRLGGSASEPPSGKAWLPSGADLWGRRTSRLYTKSVMATLCFKLPARRSDLRLSMAKDRILLIWRYRELGPVGCAGDLWRETLSNLPPPN